MSETKIRNVDRYLDIFAGDQDREMRSRLIDDANPSADSEEKGSDKKSLFVRPDDLDELAQATQTQGETLNVCAVFVKIDSLPGQCIVVPYEKGCFEVEWSKEESDLDHVKNLDIDLLPSTNKYAVRKGETADRLHFASCIVKVLEREFKIDLCHAEISEPRRVERIYAIAGPPNEIEFSFIDFKKAKEYVPHCTKHPLVLPANPKGLETPFSLEDTARRLAESEIPFVRE